MVFDDTDIVVFNEVISRYDVFKILNADDEDIRLATKEEVLFYYSKWNK
jgi:hypothetical protein